MKRLLVLVVLSVMLFGSVFGGVGSVAGATDDPNLIVEHAPENGYATIGRVSITFDDSYESAYLYAYPILEARNIPATAYIKTDVIGDSGKLTASEIVALQAGGWEIGSHSVSHPNMASLSVAEMQEEYGDSKATLESLGCVVSSFAYPYGYGGRSVQSDDVGDTYYDFLRSTTTGNPYYTVIELGTKVVDAMSVNRPLSDFEDRIDMAVTNHAWVIFYIHNVGATGTFDEYPTTNLNDCADYIEMLVEAGDLEACTFIEGYYRTREIATNFQSETVTHNTLVSDSYDLGQFAVDDPHIDLTDYTLSNEAYNTGMENWTSPTALLSWTKTAKMTTTKESTITQTGNYAAKLTVDLTGSSSVIDIHCTPYLTDIEFAPGDPISFSIWGKVAASNQITGITARMKFFDVSSTLVGDVLTTVAPTTTYQVIGVSTTVPATANRVQWVVMSSFTTATGTADFYVDSFICQKSSAYSTVYWNGTQTSHDISIVVNDVPYNGDSGRVNIPAFVRYVNVSVITVHAPGVVDVTLHANLSAVLQYGLINQVSSYIITKSYKDVTSVIVQGLGSEVSAVTGISYVLLCNATIGNIFIEPSVPTVIYLIVYDFAASSHNAIVVSWYATHGLGTEYRVVGLTAGHYNTVWREGKQIWHKDVGATLTAFSGWGASAFYEIKMTNILTNDPGILGTMMPFIGALFLSFFGSVLYTRGFSLSSFLVIFGISISILVWLGAVGEYGLVITAGLFAVVLFMGGGD